MSSPALSDVFVRLRHMGFQALGERLEVAREVVKHLPKCSETRRTNQRNPRLREMVEVLLARAELIALAIRNEKPPQSLSVAHARPGKLDLLTPAYVTATLMTSQRYSVLWADDGAVRTSAQSIAWMLLKTTP